MTVTLTPEQSRQLSQAVNHLSFAVDPASRRRYVLLKADVFERMRMMVGEASMQDVLAPAWAEVAADHDD
ncbi:MAG TPA: hypothetical protein VKE40_15815 [Gemmataceae bacterium]|jgi:hypothetical protein|nr:hypothetical protein [Gemmataceae bacterium]